MKQYYLHNGTENIGPFTIEDLKEKKITKLTPVWSEDMEDWKEAQEVEELKDILIVVPPQFIKKETKQKVIQGQVENDKQAKTGWFRRLLKILLIVIAIMICIAIVSELIENRNSSSPTYEESVMTIAEMEEANPIDYLESGGQYKENFFGDKLKVEGYIENKATVTTYKDVVIEITYYSKTNSPMKIDNYTIFEFFEPTSKKPFKLKINNYSDINSIGWRIVGARLK